jgi:hypothetical protein
MMKKGIILLLITLLAACTASPNTSPTSAVATPTREGSVISEATGEANDVIGDPGIGFGISDLPNAPFAALVTGDVEITVTGDGSYGCENGTYVIRSSAGDFPQISLILPIGNSTGQFELGNNDGQNASASLFLADGRAFAGGIEGLLIVNSIATAPTQLVTGNFVFEATNGGDNVEVSGQFNFMAGVDTVFCE